jgi:hypothetical protein
LRFRPRPPSPPRAARARRAHGARVSALALSSQAPDLGHRSVLGQDAQRRRQVRRRDPLGGQGQVPFPLGDLRVRCVRADENTSRSSRLILTTSGARAETSGANRCAPSTTWRAEGEGSEPSIRLTTNNGFGFAEHDAPSGNQAVVWLRLCCAVPEMAKTARPRRAASLAVCDPPSDTRQGHDARRHQSRKPLDGDEGSNPTPAAFPLFMRSSGRSAAARASRRPRLGHLDPVTAKATLL